MITEIDQALLEKIADLVGKPVGALNIRKDGGCEARQSTEHIKIDKRADGKPHGKNEGSYSNQKTHDGPFLF